MIFFNRRKRRKSALTLKLQEAQIRALRLECMTMYKAQELKEFVKLQDARLDKIEARLNGGTA